MMTILLAFIFSFLATVGFAVITNVPRRTLLYSGLTGSLAWLTYLLITNLTQSIILSNLCASLVIGLLANIFAQKAKTAVNILYIPCLVSLVPGAIIYRSMQSFTLGDLSKAEGYLLQTVTIAISLALGFLIAETIVTAFWRFYRKKISHN